MPTIEGKTVHALSTSNGDVSLGRPSLWTQKEQRAWVLALFVGLVVLYANRMALPVSVVELGHEMEWSKKTSGMIMSTFYWGYAITQVVGGQLADSYGGEVVLWMFGVVWSVSVLFFTVAANVSNGLMAFANFVSGLSQAVHFPAMVSLVATRVSEERRSFVYGLVNAGAHLGTVLSGILGYLFLFRHGWEYMFITVGGLGLVWALLLRSMAARLAHRMHYQLLSVSMSRDETAKKKKSVGFYDVPWKALFRQTPILAMFYSHFCQGFFLHSMMVWIPSFFHDVFPDHQNKAWLYNALPWMSMCLATILGGWLANRLISAGFSITNVRKVLEGSSFLGSIIPLLVLAEVGASSAHFTLAVSCIVAALSFQSFNTSGSAINPTDLTPSYSGLVFGVMNTISTAAGIIGVSFTSHILHKSGSWPTVFVMISGVNLSGLFVFSLLGSGRRLTHIDTV